MYVGQFFISSSSTDYSYGHIIFCNYKENILLLLIGTLRPENGESEIMKKLKNFTGILAYNELNNKRKNIRVNRQRLAQIQLFNTHCSK